MVDVNGGMVAPLGSAGGDSDPRGPGTGTITLKKSVIDDKTKCRGEIWSGTLACTFEYDIEMSPEAGTAILIHLVSNRFGIGIECSKGRCRCRDEDVRHVEYMTVGKRFRLTEELSKKVVGCGCYVRMVGSLFLVSSKSPLASTILGMVQEPQGPPDRRPDGRIMRMRGITKRGPKGGVIEPGTIGNTSVIDTGSWMSSYLNPEETADLLDLLLAAAMDSKIHDCETAKNCCGPIDPVIPTLPVVQMKAETYLSNSY
jgi:hypothetical protein